MPKARTFRTLALVLNRRDFGEADRLLTLLTPAHGRIDAIAKGARKPASRKTGHVELFTEVDVLLAKGRELFIVTQAEMKQPYLAIREDLIRGAYANYAAELLNRFTYSGDDTLHPLYELLKNTFHRLCDDPDPRRVIRYYELHLLDEVGFRPELTECVVTHEDIQPVNQYFSYDGGGVVSVEGAAHTAGLIELPMRTLKVLRHMQRNPYEQVAALNIANSLHIDLERVMLGYLRYILESRLQSADFIRRVRQLT